MGKDSEKGKYTSPEGSPTWEYICLAVCTIGAFTLGKLLGWNSPSLAEFNGPNSRIQMTPEVASTLTACLGIGQMISLPFSLFVVDKIGRRNIILLSSLPMTIQWVMILLAEHSTVLIVARLLAGFSVGIMLCAIPIYMAEILSANIRGMMGSLSMVTYFSGVLFMFVVTPNIGVRVTACVCIGSTLLFAISSWFIPESPYFLMMVGREEEAEIALMKLRGKTDVADEIDLVKATLREKGKFIFRTDETEEKEILKSQSAFKQLFTVRGNLKAFFVGILLTTLQHLSGLSTILSYCHIILEAIGSGLDTYVASMICSILQVFACGISVFIIKRFGRRPILFTTSIVGGLLLLAIGTYFYLLEHTDIDVKPYGIIPLVAFFAMVMVISVGVMPLPPTITAEIFAPDVKVLANCVVLIVGSLWTIFTAKSYLVIAISWGYGHSIPFIGYAVSIFLCLGFLVPLLPETKDQTLLDIQRALNA